MNNSTDVEFPAMRAAADALDKASVWFSLITGIPGNLFIFLTVTSFPASVARFHFQLLSLMDMTALILQLSIRGIDWYGLAIITSKNVTLAWKIYFNVTYFVSVYANWVLVYIAMERLIALRYPSETHIYMTLSRARVNAVITAILMISFCVIVTVKMNYFGIAWLVVFTTFYTAFPLLLVFIIIWLLLGTMEEQRRQKVQQKKEREKHHHHHHKDGYRTPAITPTGAKTPVGGLTPTSGPKSTMTKSISTHSKHTLTGLPTKHDHHISGATTSVSRQNLALTLAANLKRPSSANSENSHETLEVINKKAQEKRDVENCYTFMMLALSVTFVLLTVPYTAIEYIYVSSDREIIDIFDEKQTQMYLLIVIALALMFIEHSCNFFIFFFCSWRFRQQFIQVITRKSAVPTVEITKEPDQSKTLV